MAWISTRLFSRSDGSCEHMPNPSKYSAPVAPYCWYAFCLCLVLLRHLKWSACRAGECGTSVAAQWAIRAELKAMFAEKPWLDVFTKQDLLQPVRSAASVGSESLRSIEERTSSEAQEEACSSSGSAEVEERRSTHSAACTSAAEARHREEVSTAAPQADCVTPAGEGDVLRHAESLPSTVEATQMQPRRSAGGRSFAWNGKTEGGLQTALEVAQALPAAVWVSSVTQEGMPDLQAAVLHMLQTQRLPEAGERTSHGELVK